MDHLMTKVACTKTEIWYFVCYCCYILTNGCLNDVIPTRSIDAFVDAFQRNFVIVHLRSSKTWFRPLTRLLKITVCHSTMHGVKIPIKYRVHHKSLKSRSQFAFYFFYGKHGVQNLMIQNRFV